MSTRAVFTWQVYWSISLLSVNKSKLLTWKFALSRKSRHASMLDKGGMRSIFLHRHEKFFLVKEKLVNIARACRWGSHVSAKNKSFWRKPKFLFFRKVQFLFITLRKKAITKLWKLCWKREFLWTGWIRYKRNIVHLSKKTLVKKKR